MNEKLKAAIDNVISLMSSCYDLEDYWAYDVERIRSVKEELEKLVDDLDPHCHKRHFDDTRVAEDVNCILSECLAKWPIERETPKIRAEWQEFLVDQIVSLRDNNLYYKTPGGKRCYMSPTMSAGCMGEKTVHLYGYVLQEYHDQIGCEWEQCDNATSYIA